MSEYAGGNVVKDSINTGNGSIANDTVYARQALSAFPVNQPDNYNKKT
jgi:hypothetical protein